jgi:Gpi18-like mannosyltransferase
MYTAGFLASLCYLLEGRPTAALVAFGFSCALKPQSIYWAPFVAGLLLSRRLPWRLIWVPLAVYLTCGIPQMLAGRAVTHTIEHWARVRNWPDLVLGAPNWYQWVFESNREVFYWTGIVLTLCATAFFALWMAEAPRKGEDSKPWIVSLALLSVLFPPFLLPGMHERYFFAADIISLVYAFYVAGGWRATLLIQCASAFVYVPYLFQHTAVPPAVLPLLILAALALVVREVIRLRPKQDSDDELRHAMPAKTTD